MIIAVYYIALDQSPHYREIAELSVASAVRANPGARVLHARNPQTEPIKAAHGEMVMDVPPTPEEVVVGKAAFTCWLGKHAEENWAMVDADVIHRKPIEPLLDGCAVALLRRGYPIMIVNTGLIVGRPGHPQFWEYYETAISSLVMPLGDSLPPVCHPWWCEQLAFSGMVGSLSIGDVEVMDAKVRLYEMADVLPAAKDREDLATLPGVGIHFKGRAKERMARFAKEAMSETTTDIGGPKQAA